MERSIPSPHAFAETVPAGPGRRFRDHRLLHRLLALYLILWIATAIAPYNRRDWFLENLLVFLSIALLAATYRRLRFSDRSWLVIAVFLALHTIGAYYIYENVPLGFWLQRLFAARRNSYDRLVHGAFGLLLGEPFRETYLRTGGARGAWSYFVPVLLVTALSAVYEILEAVVAEIVSPSTGVAFLGSQGDGWDAQKDIAWGIGGALLWALLAAGGRAFAHRGALLRRA